MRVSDIEMTLVDKWMDGLVGPGEKVVWYDI